jgi:ferritin-like metal-binding protein YciE
MVQRGVRPSIATFGTLITAASDAGDLEAVQIVSAVHQNLSSSLFRVTCTAKLKIAMSMERIIT